MHVCMFVTNDVTNDPRVMREATALVEAGHVVRVFGVRSVGTEPAEECCAGIQVRRFDLWHMRLVRWLKAQRGLGPREGFFTPAAAAVHQGGHQRGLLSGILHQAQLVLHILTVLVPFSLYALQQQADVYHAHDVDTLLPALLVGWWGKKPVIYDSHEYWYNERRDEAISNRIIRWIERLGVRHCACAFVVNHSIAERVAAHYHIPTPTVLMNVPAGVSPPPSPLRDGQPIELLYHGGYMAGRGLESLISAMTMVKEPVHLTLRGYGDLEWALKGQVEALGLQSRVTFAPPVPMQELVRLASVSHVGIIPYSRQHAEFALPNKIFEYMAAGLAIIANDLIEFRRIVVEHDVGIVCDAEDPESLAQAIDILAGDRARLETCRQRAWQIYHQYYTWRAHQRVLLEAYARLEGGRERPGVEKGV